MTARLMTGIVTLGAVAIGLLFYFSLERKAPPSPAFEGAQTQEQEAETHPLSAEQSSLARRPVAGSQTSKALDGSLRPVALAKGLLVEGATGRGLEGYAVAATLPHEVTGAGILPWNATTGPDGWFDLPVDSEAPSTPVLHLTVHAPAGELVFSESVLFKDGLLIQVGAKVWLHGALIGGEGRMAGNKFSLTQPHAIPYANPRLLAMGILSESQTFGAFCYGVKPDEPITLSVSDVSQVWTFVAPLTSYTSAEGFLARLVGRELVIQVLDEQGSRLEGARVGGGPLNSSLLSSFLWKPTDKSGEVRFTVGPSDWEVTAHAPGRRSFYKTVKAEGVEGEVVYATLPLLDDTDSITGVVTDYAGEPVTNAVVSALVNATSEASRTAGAVVVRTAPDGTFSLRLGGPEYVLQARHKSLGHSQYLTIVPQGQHVELALRGGQSIEISASLGGGVSKGLSEGVVGWFLRSDNGHEDAGAGALPFRTELVPPGDYGVFLYWPDLDLYGESRIAVTGLPRDELRLDIKLEPATWFRGRASPDIQRIVNVRPDWPSQLRDSFGTGVPGNEAAFRVLSGAANAGTLVVYPAANEQYTLHAVATDTELSLGYND